MKTRTFISLVVITLLFAGVKANAQLGKLKEAAGKATNTVKSDKKTNETTSTTTTSSSNTETKATSTTLSSSASGTGDFFTSFKPNGFKTEVNIGDELYVRMNLGKTMIELSQEKGIEASFTAYGFVSVYIDNNKIFTTEPISFASNISKNWLYMDIPLNVNPDFMNKIAADQSMLETEQDIWMFQQLFQEKSIPKQYAGSAMKTMTSGSHTVKVEFGLGSSDSKEPVAVVCTASVKVVVDAAGSEAIAMNGPKYLRPLKEEEKGKFVFNSTSFTPGLSELTVKIELPQAPKYYNVKWCKATTCDYDHGSLLIYASLDNEPLAYWTVSFDSPDYSSGKSYNMIIFPKTDAGIDNFQSDFNTSKLFKGESPVVYSLMDKVLGGSMNNGKHTLKIKIYSQECVPYDVSYEYQDKYFAQWPSIAENTIEFNVTDEVRNALISSSSAKKLSHATGDWLTLDNELKASYANVSEVKVFDIATQTEWKIIKNSLGVILYRECRADVIYKSSKGCRVQKRLVVQEDYSGGGTYGKPYFPQGIQYGMDSSELSTMHYAVPESKVK